TDYTFTSADAGSHVFSVIFNTSGTQALTATDTANSSISGSQTDITVTPTPATTMTLSGSPNPAVFGQNVTLTAKLASTTPGSIVPTGRVAFRNGNTILGTVPLDNSGTATLSTNNLPPGSNSI